MSLASGVRGGAILSYSGVLSPSLWIPAPALSQTLGGSSTLEFGSILRLLRAGLSDASLSVWASVTRWFRHTNSAVPLLKPSLIENWRNDRAGLFIPP